MLMAAIGPLPLYSLVYTSTAARPLAKSDLENILLHARKNNLQEHVTGLLLFTEGKFMQYLEGPQSGVLKIFDTIKKSKLHTEITEVSRKPLASREYGDWSMAFLADVDAHSLQRAVEDENAPLMDGMKAPITGTSSRAQTEFAELLKNSSIPNSSLSSRKP